MYDEGKEDYLRPSEHIGLDWMQLGLGPGHIVLDAEPAPSPPKGHSPQFSAHICCGKMSAWIKMPLGMDY